MQKKKYQSKTICPNKIEVYETYLKLAYWTISEIQWLLCGQTKFSLYAVMHPWLVSIFGRTGYGLCPSLKNRQQVKQLEIKIFPFISNLLAAIENNEVEAQPFKMLEFPSYLSDRYGYTKNGVSYFLKPYELIGFIATNGFTLPQELEIATTTYLKKNRAKPLLPSTSGIKKQLQRQAVAQFYWYKYPKLKTIKKICDKINELKANTYYKKFLYESRNRAMKVVSDLKPLKTRLLPEVIKKNDNLTTFDFQKVKIIIRTIANLLIEKSGNLEDLSEEKIIQHPLISSYISEGCPKHIIEFALKESFVYLHDEKSLLNDD